MKCFNGVETSEGFRPCRQCISCRINQQRKWAGRILLELAAHRGPVAQFVTLTYADEHLPRTEDDVPTLRKQQIKDFIKNFSNRHSPLRYFLVGEYGDLSLRPHYHLVIFPRSHSQVADFCEKWSFGFTSAYPVDEARARYIARYTVKKLTSDHDARLSPGQEPEFRSSSRVPPIGAPFIPTLVDIYSRGAGKKLVSERGDIERSFRLGKRIYPLDQYMLRKVRTALGIPLKHSDRADHPNYLQFHEVEEAECNPEIEISLARKYRAKTKQTSRSWNQFQKV